MYKNHHSKNFTVNLFTILSLIGLLSSLSTFLDNNVEAQNWYDGLDLCMNANDQLRYTGPGITIKYPCDWREVNPSQFASQGGNVNGLIIGFVSPRVDDSDIFTEYVNIMSEKLDNLYIDLDTLLENEINYWKEAMQDSNFQIIEMSPNSIILNGNKPAGFLVFTGTNPETGTSAKTMEVITKDGDELFAITFSAQLEEFNNYLPVFQQMLSSLEFFNLNAYLNPNLDSNPNSGIGEYNVPPDRIITPDCGVVTDDTPCYE